MALVGMKKIAGKEYEVHAGIYGTWTILDEEGQSLGGGDSLDKATANAQNELTKRKVKIDVPFYTYEGRRGTITGRHARTMKVLARIEGSATNSWTKKSATSQLEGYYHVFRNNIPTDVLDNYLELKEKQRNIESEMRKITSQYGTTAGELAANAIQEATAKATGATA